MGRIVKLVLYFFLYQLVVAGGMSGLFMIWHGKFPDPSDDCYITYLLVIQVTFTMIVCMHLLFGKYVCLDRKALAYYNSGKVLLLSLFFIVGMGLWNNYLNELVDLPNTMEVFFDKMMVHPLGVFATVVMAPLMEELFFRGAIEGHLLRVWKNPVGAIVVSSLLFGVVHGNPAQIPFAFVVGMGLGWMYYITGSLVPCIFMHFINNGTAVLTFWIVGDSEASLLKTLGFDLATVVALAGAGITVLSVYGIRQLFRNKSVKWIAEDA